jgi:hypothetical protein
MQPTQPRDAPAESVSNGERPDTTEGDRAVADAAVRVQPAGSPHPDLAVDVPSPALPTSAFAAVPALPADVERAPTLPDIAPPAAANDAPAANGAGPAEGSACTQAQLRRFIKSRPYVPMHELRRRFELNGEADDVNPVRLSGSTVYVGLPPRESGFLADLARQGEIGLELCHDPLVAVVVGVYAMRPVSR